MRHPARRLQRREGRRRARGLRDARGRADVARRGADGTGRLHSRRVLNGGWIGILSAELHFPESRSLKQKRVHLRSAKAQLQNRFGAAVAEVDHHDTWQRARITAAVVTREHREAERLLADAERYLASREWELALVESRIVTLDDA